MLRWLRKGSENSIQQFFLLFQMRSSIAGNVEWDCIILCSKFNYKMEKSQLRNFVTWLWDRPECSSLRKPELSCFSTIVLMKVSLVEDVVKIMLSLLLLVNTCSICGGATSPYPPFHSSHNFTISWQIIKIYFKLTALKRKILSQGNPDRSI